MFAPPMMSAPPSMPYRAPTYAPQQPPAVPALPRQNTVPTAAAPPKPLIRAQAPEEPNPARPPLLTLPSPEKLGVAVRPVANTIDWTAIHARMKQLGVVSYQMERLADGRSCFTCRVPTDRPGVLRRIESVAATEDEAVQLGLRQVAQIRGQRP
ncbi:MAG TPA: hypothetical protein VMG10_15765 [Gemmataceae bacterium]|nr:hypothetical protein [Gemmataceae bacterium]